MNQKLHGESIVDEIFSPGALAGVGAIAGVSLLLLTVRLRANVVDGVGVLTYGWPMKLFVAGAWVFWIVLLIAAFFADEDDRALAAGVVIGGFVLVLIMHLEVFFVRILFDDWGVQTASPWRRKRLIPWSDFESVRYSPMNRWHVLQTKSHGCVRASEFLDGVHSLLEACRRHRVPFDED